jgi:hypothetical protein
MQIRRRTESAADRDHLRPLTFTPAEWRRLLADPRFLQDDGNRYATPRRLWGLPVRIVSDHTVPPTLAEPT